VAAARAQVTVTGAGMLRVAALRAVEQTGKRAAHGAYGRRERRRRGRRAAARVGGARRRTAAAVTAEAKSRAGKNESEWVVSRQERNMTCGPRSFSYRRLIRRLGFEHRLIASV
jgi:hypothetical protein